MVITICEGAPLRVGIRRLHNLASVVSMFLLLASISSASGQDEEKTLHIGFLVPMEGAWDGGRTMAPAVPVAIEALQGDPLLNGYKLTWSWRNSACSPGTALKMMTELLAEGIDMLLGPSCSVCCEPTQLLASTTNLPQVSYSCTSGTLSDKLLYPTFVRTVGPYSVLGPAIVTVFNTFGWKRCGLLSSTQSLFLGAARSFRGLLAESGFVVDIFETFDPGAGDVTPMMQRIKEKYVRVIIMLTYSDYYGEILVMSDKIGMGGEGWAWLALDQSPSTALAFLQDEGFDGTRDSWLALMQGTLQFYEAVPRNARYEAFGKEVTARTGEFGVTLRDDESLSSYAAPLYDAVELLARAVGIVSRAGLDPKTLEGRAAMVEAMRTNPFEGMSGFVQLDEKGDRYNDVEVISVQPDSSGLVVGKFFLSTKTYQVDAVNELIWPGNTKTAPIDLVLVCEPGTSPLGITCIDCAAGTEGKDGLKCTPCAAGSYSDLPGSPECTKCPAGNFQDRKGQTECPVCPVGLYSETPGQTECAACPAKSSNMYVGMPGGLKRNRLKDCKCLDGYFGTPGGECTRCPEGAHCCGCPEMEGCNKLVAGIDLEEGDSCPAELQSVLWANLARGGDLARPCTAECVHGSQMPMAKREWFQKPESPVVFVLCETGGCKGGLASKCEDGFFGERCGDCVQGYFFTGTECQVCPEGNKALFVVLILLAGFFIFFIIIAAQNLFKCGAIAILSDFVQTTALYMGFPLGWPTLLRDLFDLMSALNFNVDLLSPGCTVDVNYYTEFTLKTLLPLFVIPVIPILYVAVDGLHWFGKISAQGVQKRKWQLSNAFFNVLSIGYTFMVSQSMSVFNCPEFSGTQYLNAASYLRCYEGDWTRGAVVGGIAAIVYGLGIPLFFFVSLRQVRKSLFNAEYKRRMGSIYIVYSADNWWFEVWTKGRKLCLIFVISFFPNILTLQVISGLSILFAAIIVSSQVRPFRFAKNNRLLFYATMCNFATLFGGLLFYSEKMEPQTTDNVAVIIFILVLLVCLSLLRGVITEYVAYWGSSHVQRHPGLRPVLDNAVMNMLFDSRKALHNSNHWAYQDEVMDAVKKAEQIRKLSAGGEQTERMAQLAAQVDKLRHASITSMSVTERSSLAEVLYGYPGVEGIALMTQWEAENPEATIILHNVFRQINEWRAFREGQKTLRGGETFVAATTPKEAAAAKDGKYEEKVNVVASE